MSAQDRAPGTPLRILISSYFYPPSIGGVERQTFLLARGLVRRGHRVRVVAALHPGAPAREEHEGVEIVRVSAGAGNRWTKMAGYLAATALELARASGWAQLVHVQQALYPAAAAALACLPLRLPLVVTNHGSGVAGAAALMGSLPLGSASLRLIAARATVACVNDQAVEELRGLGFPRLQRILNAVEVPAPVAGQREEARSALGLDGRVALFLGRLEPEKNLEVLLRAWSSAGRPGWTLAIVGDGSERPLVERLSAGLPPGSVRIAGAVRDPAPWLRAADLLVLPSKSEGISNALLEAMAHGLAPVASDVGGNRQVIARPALGRLVPPGDAPALALALAELLGDQARCAALGAAARAHVAEAFSVEAMVLAYERLYRGVLGGRLTAAASPPPPAAGT